MSDEVTTDDKAVEVEVKVEDDTKEPVKAESQGVVEETTQKHEPSKQSPEGKRSAGQVIADLGNEKKAIAASLVNLAKSSEAARVEAQKMLVADPSIASYMKTKFGEDYDLITGEESVVKDGVDLEKIREEERTKAQAEVIREQMKTNQDKMVEARGKELGLNTEEFEQFKAKVSILGGDEAAMEDAALIVNSTKATARPSVDLPSGGEAGAPVTKEVTITTGLNEFAKGRNLDTKTFATEIDRVKSLHTVDRLGKPTMVLPGL